MEDTLKSIIKEAVSPKFAGLRKSCTNVLDVLGNKEIIEKIEVYQLRQKCLTPLTMAMETRNIRLCALAVVGLNKLASDERLQSKPEEEQEKWMPMQILQSFSNATSLPDDTQIDIMKMLLSVTVASDWLTNAVVMIKLSELSITMFNANGENSVRTAIKASMTQIMSTLAENVFPPAQGNRNGSQLEISSNGTVANDKFETSLLPLLYFLCERLAKNYTKPSVAMILEALLAITINLPDEVRDNNSFVTLIWKELCPSLVYLLGNPLLDKTINTNSSKRTNVQDSELGRGSGCSAAAPSVNTQTAATIYHMSVELVRLVGCMQSLRPVLESVFHRMLLYPPPMHRLDAIKIIKKVLGKPERLVDLAGPTLNDSNETKAASSNKRNTYQDIALLKLIVDSVVECSRCSVEHMALASIQVAHELLKCMENLVKGEGLSDLIVQEIHVQYKDDNGDIYEMDDDDVGDVSENVVREGQSCDDSSDDEDEEEMDSKEVQVKKLPAEDGDTAAESSDDEFEKSKIRELMNGAGVSGMSENEEMQRAYHRELLTSKNQELEETERQNARNFITQLKQTLPTLLECSYWEEVDQMMLQFASAVATEVNEKSGGGHMSALNADGVYFATYYSLLLNLKLVTCGYYHSEEKSLPITQDQFVEDMLSTDLLLYLTPTWLTEVYQHIIHFNLLGDAGYLPHAHPQPPSLITLLSDLDGLGSNKAGSQMLLQYQSNILEPSSPKRTTKPSNTLYTAKLHAGMKLCSRMLRVCWSGLLAILSSQFGAKSSSNIGESIASLLASKDEATHRQIISTSLDGLCTAAQLACTLGLHDLCGAVFFQLTRASCVVEDTKKGEDKKPLCLQATHALCLDVVLKMGLEIGSHSADCWKHIFRCCGHISEFEHICFSSGFYDKYLPKIYQEQSAPQDHCDLTMDSLYPAALNLDYGNALQAEPVLPKADVASIIKQSMEEGGDHGITGAGTLSPQDTSRALFALSQHVERLFEDAASQLNMKALQGFLKELCVSSALQLRGNTKIERHTGTSALHLHRLGDVLLKVLRSGRPLIHLVNVWNVVSPYLIQASCHRDHNISKKAVSCIHEFVTSVIQTQEELPYSHFNEMFVKPLESLLSLDLCNGDVQDQVVCCICELVEACASQIKSGWRPLFGALRSIKIEYTTDEDVNESRKNHIAAVLDVFDVFLSTDNVIVFSNAAIDCILCLLKYVKGPGEFCSDENMGESDSEDEGGVEMLCQPALQYLQQFCTFLSNMYNMPACPVFHDANRIQTSHILQSVDPVVPCMDLLLYQQPFLKQAFIVDSGKGKNDSNAGESGAKEHSNSKQDSKKDNKNEEGEKEDPGDSEGEEKNSSQQNEDPMFLYYLENPAYADKTAFAELSRIFKDYSVGSLDEVDNHTGVLHVWFLVLEGLADAVATGPKTVQPQILHALFDLLKAAVHVTALEGKWSLSIYSVNYLVLPMLQSWLRKASLNTEFWHVTMTNFKQFVGLTTDLIVDFLIQFTCEDHPMVAFMLKSLLDFLTECIAQPNEAVSRLGCSCFRHLLLSTGPILSEPLWQIAVLSMENALHVTLYNLRLLMTPFQVNSNNFYGDLGHVKIGVRKDCSPVEAERLRQLAQQVFLLDSQISKNSSSSINYNIDEQPSFIFLIYPPSVDGTDPNDLLMRVPFRNVVEGLVCHQMLLHTVGCILLQGSKTKLPVEADIIPDPTIDPTSSSQPKSKLPGLMSHMSCRNVVHLINCLHRSYNTSKQFDERPGLKFLIQKVAGAEVAANLYKQAGLAATFYLHALFEICSSQDNININNTHMMLTAMKNDPKSVFEMEDYNEALDSVHPVINDIPLLMCLFKEFLDEVSQTYINLIIDAEGPQKSDQFAMQQMLVFLLAPPEELPQLKREKSISEMVAEKLKTLHNEKRSSIPEDAIPTTFETATGLEDQVVPPSSTGSSEPQSPKHFEKGNAKPKPQEDKVYTVASNDTINNLMSQYKKHKQAKTMPTFVKAQRSKPAPAKKTLPANSDPVDLQIHQQQETSIVKDSEACLQCWMEVLVSVLKLFEQLPDGHYQALLPVAFGSFNQLVCYGRHAPLKESLSHWIHHMGCLYGLSPHGMAKPKSVLKN